MRSKVLFVLPYVVLLIFSYLLFYKKETNGYSDSHVYFLILTFILPSLLNIIFPKLKETGFGTSKFFPYLINLMKRK